MMENRNHAIKCSCGNYFSMHVAHVPIKSESTVSPYPHCGVMYKLQGVIRKHSDHGIKLSLFKAVYDGD